MIRALRRVTALATLPASACPPRLSLRITVDALGSDAGAAQAVRRRRDGGAGELDVYLCGKSLEGATVDSVAVRRAVA